MTLLFVVALCIFAVGSIMVAAGKWSQTGFILEAVGATIAAVVALVQLV